MSKQLSKQQQAVKDRINDKFGTVSAFGRAADIDRTHLQKVFMPFYSDNPFYKQELNRISDLVDTVDVINNIDQSKIDLLKEAIENRGGVVKFSLENEQFSKDSLFQILAGRRQRMSPVLQSLFDFFKIE